MSDEAEPKEPRGYKGWFFTWNNPTLTGPDFRESLLSSGCCRARFQLERCPTTGTPHFQGGAQWKSQVRLSTLTKRYTGIHLERLNDSSLEYGAKEETRIDGPWAIGMLAVKRPLAGIKPEQLYPWQRVLYEELKVPCVETRRVLWLWEPDGCRGKSSLMTLLRDELGKGAVLSLEGDKKDIAHAIRQVVEPLKGPQLYDLKIAFFDVERRDAETVPYEIFAKIKDGWLFSPKYDSTDCRFPPVHVVVTANFPPNMDRISADRWDVREL